ncbi:MAG: SIMPL domain-containing protein [Pyrinomonadaceae bacterium]
MTRILIVFAMLASSSSFIAAQAPTQPKLPTIDVTGMAEILVAPDQVVFSLEVTKRNKDVAIAKRETDAALTKILDLTRKFGIRPEDAKTDYISVDMKYQSIRDPSNRIFDEDGDEIGTRIFLGYDVSTTVIVRLTDLKRFEDFFGEVIKTGVSEIDSVKFESSQLIEQRKKAREMAMKAAYDKASAMAAAVNQSIGKAIYIAEGTPPDSRYGRSANTSNIVRGPVTVSESVATFSPGAIKISAQVTVTFLLN